MTNKRTSDTAKTLPPTDGEKAVSRRITFLVLPRFNMATLMTLIEPMRIANYLSPAPIYSWELASFDGATLTASNGFSLCTPPPVESKRRGEMIFVMGSWGAENYHNKDLFAWLRRQARDGARICAVELGSYVVARAGLLAGRKVTTHWSYVPGFQEKFPDINTVEQLFTVNDHVLTCAGGLAGVDLMLHLIAEDLDQNLADEIADQMMHHPLRPANAPQRQTVGRSAETLAPLIRDAVALVEKNIAEPLSIPDIAATLGLSQRQLERHFKKAVGCTMVQFGLLLRLQHARVLLVSTDLGVREIATASGFNSLSHFAFSFGKCFGRRPSEYRQAWPETDTAPSWPGTLSKFLLALQNRGNAQPLHVLRRSKL